MPMQFYIGGIVEVSASDCVHYGKQGQIVGFKNKDETQVRVWFGKELDYLIDYPEREQVRLNKKYSIEPPPSSEQHKDPRTYSFTKAKLTACSGWNMQTLAERHFKGMWHSYYETKQLFIPGTRDCDVEDCVNKTAQRIIFNIWGTVIFADVCSTCAPKYHLLCGDMFPWKKRTLTKIADE